MEVAESNTAAEPHVQLAGSQEWTPLERVAFRIGALWVLQIVLPVQASRWHRFRLIHTLYDFIMWLTPLPGERFGYYTPAGESGRWGIGSFTSLSVALLVAIVLGLIWTWFARNSKRKEYNAAYYWVRLCVRYFLALNMLDFGYEKLLPEQMPFPTIANQHTLFGEINAFRLYWHHVGLVTWYQVFLGFMELIAGVLLLFRATTAIGAIIIFGMLYNVAHANLAYDGGVHIFSFTVSVLAGYLAMPYARNVWTLLALHRDVVPSYYYPKFRFVWQRYSFYGIRAIALILLLPVYGYVRYQLHYNTNMSKEVKAPGIDGFTGFYQVSHFVWNGEELPYSPLSAVRWHNAIFEDHSTFDYKVNKAMTVRTDNGADTFWDIEKRYEMAGFAGGRKYLHYDWDAAKGELYLRDKNIVTQHERDANKNSPLLKDTKWKPAKLLTWHYSQPVNGRVLLEGKDEDGNPFQATLDRVEEHQAIHIDNPVQGQPLHYDRVFYRRLPVTDKTFDGYGASPVLGPK